MCVLICVEMYIYIYICYAYVYIYISLIIYLAQAWCPKHCINQTVCEGGKIEMLLAPLRVSAAAVSKALMPFLAVVWPLVHTVRQ